MDINVLERVIVCPDTLHSHIEMISLNYKQHHDDILQRVMSSVIFTLIMLINANHNLSLMSARGERPEKLISGDAQRLTDGHVSGRHRLTIHTHIYTHTHLIITMRIIMSLSHTH